MTAGLLFSRTSALIERRYSSCIRFFHTLNGLGLDHTPIFSPALKGRNRCSPMPQSLSQLYVHLIFSTKHREPMLLSPVREDLHAYLAAILNNQDSPALKVGGMSDHVHALFRLSKNIALAKIVEEGRVVSDCAAAHPELGTIRADSLVNTG